METNVENEEVLYTPRQVSKITGVESTLLLKWVNFFNIETKWTQENQQGHRRYSKENIEEILQLKKLIQEKKMSWDQAKVAFEGKEPQFIVDEAKTRLESKVDAILDNQLNQNEFNKMLLTELKNMNQLYQDALNRVDITQKQLEAANQKIDVLENNQKLLTEPSIERDMWNRAEMNARREGIKEWNKQPPKVRFIKEGLFTKVENVLVRQQFIDEFVESHKKEEFKRLMQERAEAIQESQQQQEETYTEEFQRANE